MMSAIAADYNRNVTLVALVQAIRVTSVVFLIPLVAKVLPGLKTVLFSFDPSQLGLLYLFRRLDNQLEEPA